FQGGTGTYRQHQLYRVVFHHTGVLGQAQSAGISVGLAAHKGLAAAADNVEFLPVTAGLEHLLLYGLNLISHGQRPPLRACVACARWSGIPDRISGWALLYPGSESRWGRRPPSH